PSHATLRTLKDDLSSIWLAVPRPRSSPYGPAPPRTGLTRRPLPHGRVQEARMSIDHTASAEPTADERRLHELGYAQELSRTMSGFSNFAVSFTIISILRGSLTLSGYGSN